MHLPRIQEIKHTEFLWQRLRQPLCEIHDVVVQVSAIGVEHLVLFMCCLDHERVAVPNWKRATSITQLPLLILSFQPSPAPICKPSQGRHSIGGRGGEERGEPEGGGGDTCPFWKGRLRKDSGGNPRLWWEVVCYMEGDGSVCPWA